MNKVDKGFVLSCIVIVALFSIVIYKCQTTNSLQLKKLEMDIHNLQNEENALSTSFASDKEQEYIAESDAASESILEEEHDLKQEGQSGEETENQQVNRRKSGVPSPLKQKDMVLSEESTEKNLSIETYSQVKKELEHYFDRKLPQAKFSVMIYERVISLDPETVKLVKNDLCIILVSRSLHLHEKAKEKIIPIFLKEFPLCGFCQGSGGRTCVICRGSGACQKCLGKRSFTTRIFKPYKHYHHYYRFGCRYRRPCDISGCYWGTWKEEEHLCPAHCSRCKGKGEIKCPECKGVGAILPEEEIRAKARIAEKNILDIFQRKIDSMRKETE